MKFLKKIIRTSVDLKGYNSILIHSLVGCNLKCYGCHNYDELVLKNHTEFLTSDEIINKIELNKETFDSIIISGGEFLINDIEKIIDFLFKIRSFFNGIIIINTNGTFPEKVKKIINLNLVNGFHMDLKFNIWDDNSFIEKSITNCNIGIEVYQNSFYQIKNNNVGFSEFRTIKYPIIKDDYFKKIEEKCKDENVVWNLNNFL